MRTRITLAACLLAVAACGAVPAGPGSPSTPPSAGPTSGAGRLTNADSGRTVHLRVGESIELVLRQEPGFSEWQGVHSSDPAVLAPVVDTHATAVRGVTLAGFRAAAPGRSTVSATAGAECSPGTACPALARAYTVTVVVDP